jgi:hypothetical protein
MKIKKQFIYKMTFNSRDEFSDFIKVLYFVLKYKM